MGYDPIWFGQVICIVTTMGSIMPPIGICCYVVAGMAKDILLRTVFRGGLYYTFLHYFDSYSLSVSLRYGARAFQSRAIMGGRIGYHPLQIQIGGLTNLHP